MHRFFAIPALDLPGKFVLTILMSLFAIILALLFPGADRFLCMAAMLISTVGDIFMMDFRSLSKYYPDHFVIGAILFRRRILSTAAAFST